MCDREGECEDSNNWRLKSFCGYLAIKHLAKWPMWLAHAGMWRVRIGWRQLCLASISRVRPSRKTFCFARLSILIHTFYAYTIYTHITHKCWGVILRENPSQTPWELEIVIPTILYTIACGFSSTPTSPFLYHWEVDSPNTYHTLSKCQVKFRCCWEVLEEA